MVVADPEATLLTACANGYGKRTLFGPNSPVSGAEPADGDESSSEESAAPAEGEGEESNSSSNRYRTQRRGGKGLRDIKTTERNGPVVSVVSVRDDDEILMMTARGKLQRMVAGEISTIGRNTQGVRIMSLDEGDTLAAVVRVPRDEDAASAAASTPPPAAGTPAPPAAAGQPFEAEEPGGGEETDEE
jgi:DNA gyrase subunit A